MGVKVATEANIRNLLEGTEKKEKEILVRSSFDKLVGKANVIKGLCTDHVIQDVSNLNMLYDELQNRLKFTDKSGEVSFTRTLPFTRHAFGQLCGKLEIPHSYIQRCLSAGQLELVAENINSWLEDYHKNLFVRVHDNKIRGVLSDRYSVFDTHDILSVLGDVVNMDKYKIQGSFLSPERFSLRLVLKEMLNIQGEDMFGGIQLDSSDVGRHRLVVRLLVFKQVCTNGMIVATDDEVLYEKKHMSIGSELFAEEFTKAMKTFEPKMERIQQAIRFSQEEELFVDSRTSQDEELTWRELFKKEAKMSDDGVERVFETMREKYGETRLGLIHAITEVAQDYTLDTRLNLESFAGRLLNVA